MFPPAKRTIFIETKTIKTVKLNLRFPYTYFRFPHTSKSVFFYIAPNEIETFEELCYAPLPNLTTGLVCQKRSENPIATFWESSFNTSTMCDLYQHYRILSSHDYIKNAQNYLNNPVRVINYRSETYEKIHWQPKQFLPSSIC